MNTRLNVKLIGSGFLAVALAGGVTAWAAALHREPPAPANGAAKDEEGDEEEVIKLADAPEAVRAALAKITPADKVTRVTKEENDEDAMIYEVEYTADGMECSAVFSAAGDVMEVEKGIKDSALPAAAAAALRKKYPGAEIGGLVSVQKFFYEVEVAINGKKHGVKVDAAGEIKDEHKAKDGEKDGTEGKEEKEEHGKKGAALPGDAWRSNFDVSKADLRATGASPYFILQPGHKMTYTGGDVVLVVTVLDETQVVDGVTTRVVEERESKAGALVEVSRNFFAIEPKSGDVYYFGEDVEIYKDGKVVKHEGEWASGKDGAKFGLFIPGSPKVGDKFYQEVAPGNALDRFEITSLTDRLDTPSGVYEKVVHADETTPLEPGAHGNKCFAAGVGMIRDDELLLSKIEPARSK